MSDDDRATQAEQLIARMKAARGYIYPEWELAARTDPDFTDAYNRIYSGAWTARGWWHTCVGPYASAPPRRNCLKSSRPRWYPVEPPRSTAG